MGSSVIPFRDIRSTERTAPAVLPATLCATVTNEWPEIPDRIGDDTNTVERRWIFSPFYFVRLSSDAVERKLHLLARRLILPHPRSPRPCRPICGRRSTSSAEGREPLSIPSPLQQLGGGTGERVHRALHQSERPIVRRAWLGRRRIGRGTTSARRRLGRGWGRRRRLGLVCNLARVALTARMFCRGRLYRYASPRFRRRSLG